MKYLVAFVTSIFLFNFFMGCTVVPVQDGEDAVVAVAVEDLDLKTRPPTPGLALAA